MNVRAEKSKLGMRHLSVLGRGTESLEKSRMVPWRPMALNTRVHLVLNLQ